MVEVHHGDQISAPLAKRYLASLLACLTADDRVRDHHVVILELADRIGAVCNALLVGLDPTPQCEDRLEVECDGTDAHLAGGLEGGRVPTGDPDRRMTLSIGLGQDVVRSRHRERFAMELIVDLFPHTGNLTHDLIPFRLGGVLVHDVEALHLMASCTTTGSPFEPVVGEVVHRRGALGEPHRVFLAGRQTVDRGAQVDVVGLRGHVADHDLRGREL